MADNIAAFALAEKIGNSVVAEVAALAGKIGNNVAGVVSTATLAE